VQGSAIAFWLITTGLVITAAVGLRSNLRRKVAKR